MNVSFGNNAGMKASLLIAALALFSLRLECQSLVPHETMRRLISLQVFSMGDATWTHHNDARNIGLTTGFNVTTRSFYNLSPSLEARITVPIDSGSDAGLETYLVGPGLTLHRGIYHPYINFLIGNGIYKLVNPTTAYISNNSLVYQFDGGLDLTVHGGWALRAEGSWQSWNLGSFHNPNGTGQFQPVSGSLGLRYRFAARPRWAKSR